jgi:coenzyme F420-reducing hydrogenase gamma subunit
MSNDKKQTAVEWLIEQFWNNEGMLTSKKLEKALEMEKEQTEQAKLDAKEIVIIKEYPTTSTTLYCQQFAADMNRNSSATRCVKCGKESWQHYEVTLTI